MKLIDYLPLFKNQTGHIFTPINEVLPKGISLEWLGVAGFRLSVEDYSVLIDPYFTRVGFSDFVLRKKTSPDLVKIKQNIQENDNAILIGHSHFDHVMDVPAILNLKKDCLLYANHSTRNLLDSLPELQKQYHEVRGGDIFDIGPFKVEVISSIHSKLLLGSIPFAGEIIPNCELPCCPQSYKCGDVYAYRISYNDFSILHLGSADLIDDVLNKYPSQMLLVCLAGRYSTEKFTQRLISSVRPNVVVPMHFDNFFISLQSSWQNYFPFANITGFIDECRQIDPHIMYSLPSPLKKYQRL